MSENCNNDTKNYSVPVTGLTLDLNLSDLPGCECEPKNEFAGPSYSPEEQWTGGYWVDGRKIYSKTVFFGALPNAESKLIPHGIANLERAIYINAIATDPVSLNNLPLPWVSYGSTGPHQELRVRKNDINIKSGSDLSAYSETYVTIHYICTDR